MLYSNTIAQVYTYEYTSAGVDIYNDIIKLKLDKANSKLQQHLSEEPNNLSYLHLQSYLDFFTIFISEDENYFKQAQKRKAEIIKSLEKNLSDDNPYKKFALAEVQLHSAINKSKFGQMLKSAREILSAYHLLKVNEEEHPDFILNKKSLSVIHSLAETVSLPGIIKKLFGIKGTLSQGLDEIEDLISYSRNQNQGLFNEEIDAIYLYILMYQANDPKKALAYLSESRLVPKESLLSTFMVAKIYQKLGENDMALITLQNKPQALEYADFLYLDLMEGICLLRKLQPSCMDKIMKYIEGFKGRHYIKEAYQKLAWSKLIFEDDIVAYKTYIGQTTQGNKALVDDDKQAVREGKTHLIPNPELLTARLLSDGGYHEKAYAYLVQKAYKYTDSNRNNLEFNYRMGRICQALKNYPEALEYFDSTIELGKDLPAYYACNASLQTGLIYEEIHNDNKAVEYFEQCLQIEPSDYKSSLHQKAKTGLSRVKSNPKTTKTIAH